LRRYPGHGLALFQQAKSPPRNYPRATRIRRVGAANLDPSTDVRRVFARHGVELL